MKRVTYLLRDATGRVAAEVVTPEGEVPDIPLWMIHNINESGWTLVQRETVESGVAAHGYANWQGVADNLAACLRVMLDDSRELSEEEAEQMLEQAQAALDDYDMAHLEVSVATVEFNPDVEHEEDGEDGEG